MRLTELSRRRPAIVDSVEDRAPNDPVARRLRELGFVAGESVEVVAAGPLGAEPLLVQVGFTRFALRRAEAARVRLRVNGTGA
ncbi:FeoA family protein [Thermomonas paludicola]|uniref:FeoA family protein n=1 Tax=Thermomonas paludicola TaxID=2884874 RepID=UPI0021146CFF|nr:FeoA domain-containing protein [Thermomonas paludicola]